MSNISVAITTRNRNKILQRCLSSLIEQTRKPSEVIIVDNGSNDHTKKTCMAFSKFLPIQYYLEKRVGIPYGRNLGIRRASGDICAFIDDDCIADKNWTYNIAKHFSSHPTSIGVIGYSHNLTPNNIPSEIEQLYYERWISENIPDPKRASIVLSGRVIDFKNCAFRSVVIKRNTFSVNVPFGDVGDEDVEIGNRLYKKNTNIYFDSTIIVLHKNSQTSGRLLYRNYWEGFANRLLLQNNLDVRKTPLHKSRFLWYVQAAKRKLKYKRLSRNVQFLLLLFLYPLSSKMGRLHATLSVLFHIPMRIPNRK